MRSGIESTENIPYKSYLWELGRPRKVLVELGKKVLIKKGKAIDICCEAGTNALYLAESIYVCNEIMFWGDAIGC